MKLEFKNLLASSLAIAAGLVLFSCGKEQKPDDETPVVDQNGNTYVTTDCITPIRYVEGDFIGGATGVSVTMEEISSNNIKFICEPGTDINSFLVQVYPMGTFYNTLIEAMRPVRFTVSPSLIWSVGPKRTAPTLSSSKFMTIASMPLSKRSNSLASALSRP